MGKQSYNNPLSYINQGIKKRRPITGHAAEEMFFVGQVPSLSEWEEGRNRSDQSEITEYKQ